MSHASPSIKPVVHWNGRIEMSDNKCMTCVNAAAWRNTSEVTLCSVCVGFKNWVGIDEPAYKKEIEHRTAVSKYLKFLPVVQAIASLSKDPSTKVGAIAFDDKMNIVSTAFNGFPRGVQDHASRYDDRPTKYKLTSHAEQNLVAQAAYGGRSLSDTTVLLTALFPCSACAKSLIQAGVKVVISPAPDADPRWEEEAKWASLMFEEAGVVVHHY